MAALRVAAGRVGDVAAVACGGLANAVGTVVGAHGLAQPAMVGTVRLFRQPAGAVSLFVLYLPGGEVKVAGACGQLPSAAIAPGGQSRRRTEGAGAPNQRLVAARAGAIGLVTDALSRREATRNESAGAGPSTLLNGADSSIRACLPPPVRSCPLHPCGPCPMQPRWGKGPDCASSAGKPRSSHGF